MGSNEAGKSVENIEIDTQGKDRPKERPPRERRRAQRGVSDEETTGGTAPAILDAPSKVPGIGIKYLGRKTDIKTES